jgi:ribosomal protein S5
VGGGNHQAQRGQGRHAAATVGFGLMCAPGRHQVMNAAGVSDVSVKVWGSRSKMDVVKAVITALQSGSAMVGNGGRRGW